MKRYCFLLCIGVLFACRNRETKEVEVNTKTFMIDSEKHEVDSILIGNKDTAFVVKSKIDTNGIDTGKVYEINILFSNKKWPTLNFKQAIGADLFLVEDLNGDNNPELLLRPEWFSSCWSSINLFSLKDNSWKLIKKDSMYFCADEYPLSKRIEKINNKYYLLTDSLTDDKFVINKKEINF